jgi:hypothetical protein
MKKGVGARTLRSNLFCGILARGDSSNEAGIGLTLGRSEITAAGGGKSGIRKRVAPGGTNQYICMYQYIYGR